MPLHHQAEQLLKELEAQGVPGFADMNVPQARELVMAFKAMQGEPEAVAEVQNILVPGPAGDLPVRIYVPEADGQRPLIVYFHGGGWVIGNIEIVDAPCRALANATGCVVASVEYRLAPETKFPGAADDCYAAAAWLAEHASELGADRSKVCVAGDSAGGNLAAVVSLMARDRGGPAIALQVLIYPVTAPHKGTSFPSYRDNAEGYLLTTRDMDWFWGHYLHGRKEAKNPYAAPLAADDLSGLPRALVITSEYDPLRDEGAEYGEQLRKAGVAVQISTYPGMIHGFFWLGGVLDAQRELVTEIARETKSALG